MRLAAIALVVVVACGDNQQPVEVVVPYGAPAFVGYKANGTWHEPKPTDRGYRVISDGPYQFVFVCGDDQTFDVEELFADPSDGDQEIATQLSSDACRVGRGDVALAEVTGTVVQPGFVILGLSGASASDSPNWSYDIIAVQGSQALLFTPVTADIIVLRRGVEIGPGANPQPVIDIRTEETPLVRTPLTIDGMVEGEPVNTKTWLVTSDGESLPIADADASPLVMRAFDLEPGERQLVVVDIEEDTTDLSYEDHAVVDASDLMLKLQPPPTVSYATSELATSVAWMHEPLDAVGFELLVAAGGTASIIHGVATATVSGNEMLDLSVDSQAPGFLDAWRPAWSHDLASSSRAFSVQASREGGCYETLLVDRGKSTAYSAPSSRCGLR